MTTFRRYDNLQGRSQERGAAASMCIWTDHARGDIGQELHLLPIGRVKDRSEDRQAGYDVPNS